MGRTNAFGNLKYRPDKQHATRIVASYQTPAKAFAEYPGLPDRQSKSFPVTAEGDARAWLNSERKRIDAGVWEPPSTIRHRNKAERITMEEYAPKWLEHRTYKGKPLKQGTKYRLRKDIENHVIPYFGGMRLVDISQADIDDWLSVMPREQEAMKANALKVLKAILRTASTPGLHGEPALIPQYPCTKSLPKPERRTETIPATIGEVKMIYDAMPERYRMSIYLAVFGNGLRIGEVCALQRRNIDLKSRRLRIDHGRVTMDPERKIDTPKTGRSMRTELIPPQLMQLVESFLEHDVPPEPDAWLFPAVRDSSQPLHPNVLRSMYEKARLKAGRPDLHFHDLRHTSLTWLAEEGATTRELMDAAGHSDVDIAMRYQHTENDRRLMLAEKMGARLLPDDTVEIITARINNIDEQISRLQEQRKAEERKLEELES